MTLKSTHLCKLVIVATLTVIWASSAPAGTFLISSTSRLILPASESHIRILGESWAIYHGTVDIGDSLWSINAAVRDDDNGGFLNGNGDTGSNIVPGMTIHCDPNSCGGDKAVARCTKNGSDNSYTIRGAVATLQPTSPEVDTRFRDPEHVLCLEKPTGSPGNDEPGTPIILDLDGNGLHLTGLEAPVLFDIDADGDRELVSWTDGSELDGFLVLDVNGNGRIDDGSELFGNHSWLVSGKRAVHGFRALEEYDTLTTGGNQDGEINADDFIFNRLRVWIDQNHDGRSDETELLQLADLGIVRVELSFVENARRDRFGNELRYNGRAWVEGPGARPLPVAATDVIFLEIEIE